MRKQQLAPLLLAALLCASCPSGDGDKETGLFIPGDLMGMVHAGSTRSINDNSDVRAEYDLLDEFHVAWILTDFTWNTIQPAEKKDASPEQWNWSGYDTYVANGNSRGKKILAILDYDTPWLHGGYKEPEETVELIDSVSGNPVRVKLYNDGHTDRSIVGEDEIQKFCNYARETVSRYDGKHGHGKVDAWCIWNEPNLLPRFWTAGMEDFFALTRAAAAAIREVNPNAVIIGGALNTTASNAWVSGLFDAKVLKDLDAVAYHPYSLGASESTGLFKTFREQARGGFKNNIWVTEVGYPTYPLQNVRPAGRYGTDQWEGSMPQVVAKTITLLAVEGAQKILWYHIADPKAADQEDSDSEDWFGLFKTNDDGSLSPKGGAYAYKLCAEYLPGTTYRGALPGAEFPEDVMSYYFEGKDGSRCLIMWNDNLYKKAIPINLNLPGRNHLLHDVKDGGSTSINGSDTYTLYNGSHSDENVLFITWKK